MNPNKKIFLAIIQNGKQMSHSVSSGFRLCGNFRPNRLAKFVPGPAQEK
jgi:hypothetical protein